MYGYGRPAFKDWMFMPNDMATKKTFTFRLDESTISTHTLEGAGFLFNTNITGTMGSQTMSGYLMYINYTSGGYVEIYKFENIDVEDFHETASTKISSYSGFTKLFSAQASTSSVKYIKVEASPTNVKVWEGADSDYSANPERVNIALTTTYGAYGFGPLAGYSSHSCSQYTEFSFRDIQADC